MSGLASCVWRSAIALVGLARVLLASQALAEDGVRHLCLAAAPTPTSGERSLSNPTGGLPDVAYTVRLDDLAPIPLSRETGAWSPGLRVGDRHTVAIAADGKGVASFHFRFEALDGAEQCLFLEPLYQTWQLWPLERTGDWCSCGPKPTG